MDGPGYPDLQEAETGDILVVESNKLTVRYHKIPESVIAAMRGQLGASGASPGQLLSPDDLVYDWDASRDSRRAGRAPVLPDLRAGATFLSP